MPKLHDGPKQIKMEGIADGVSNTLLAIEANDPVVWTKPADLHLPKDKDKVPAVGGLFKTGMNCVFCDGSVRFVSRDVSPVVLRALITPAGAEVVDMDKLEPKK